MATDILQDLSNRLAAAVEEAAQSVVGVKGRWRGPSSGIVYADDGTILTADHVLERDEGIEVELDGGSVEATVVGRDRATDLALLRVAASGLRPARWTEGPDLAAGQIALVVARPAGAVRAHLTVVASAGTGWRTRGGGKIDHWIGIDVPIFLGLSGSLLVDSAGLGLGLATTGVKRGVGVVPRATLERVATSLLQHGEVRRAYLGIGVLPVTLPAGGRETEARRGLIVLTVAAGSPAERAGLLVGDVLLQLDGQPLVSVGALLEGLDAEAIGRQLRLGMVRAGEPRELTVEPSSR